MRNKIASCCSLLVFMALFFAANAVFAQSNQCNMGTCQFDSVAVTSGSANTCTGNENQCDCYRIALNNAYGTGWCTSESYCQYPLTGTNLGSCNSGGNICCGNYFVGNPATLPPDVEGIKNQQQAKQNDAKMSVFNALPRVSAYFGYYNGSLKSPSSGASRSCEARLHVCLMNGYTDLSTVTNATQCHTVCDNTTTNQACTTTNCYSRCDGWWGSTDTCS